jgi:hypothetical protein
VLQRFDPQLAGKVVTQEGVADSCGTPLSMWPQLPQMAMRQDQRKLRLPSRWSLMYCRPCSTDMSSPNGTFHDWKCGSRSRSGS